MASAVVESARLDWDEGRRRFEDEARRSESAETLYRQLEVVTDELRRRLGDSFTLTELTEAYLGSERWVRLTVTDRAPAPGTPRTLALVADAAFHLMSTHASDFVP